MAPTNVQGSLSRRLFHEREYGDGDENADYGARNQSDDAVLASHVLGASHDLYVEPEMSEID